MSKLTPSEAALQILKDSYEVDPECIIDLIEHRAPTVMTIGNAEHIPIITGRLTEVDDEVELLGVLGLINGILNLLNEPIIVLGVKEELGKIEKITHFELLDMGKEE